MKAARLSGKHGFGITAYSSLAHHRSHRQGELRQSCRGAIEKRRSYSQRNQRSNGAVTLVSRTETLQSASASRLRRAVVIP